MDDRPKMKRMGLTAKCIWAGLCSFFVVVSFLLVSGKKSLGSVGSVLDILGPIVFGCLLLCLIWSFVVNLKQHGSILAKRDAVAQGDDADDGK